MGTVRISFGRTSSQRVGQPGSLDSPNGMIPYPLQDLDTFRRMLECCFVGPLPPSLTRPIIPDHPPHPPLGFGRLTHLFVYPIKSCPPIAPTMSNWEFGDFRDNFSRFQLAHLFPLGHSSLRQTLGNRVPGIRVAFPKARIHPLLNFAECALDSIYCFCIFQFTD